MPTRPPTHLQTIKPSGARTHEEDKRGSAASRGYGHRWRILRRMVLRRDPICVWPGCDQPSKDVDHIIAKVDGGDDLMENLRGLCHSHHAARTVRDNGGLGRGK